MLPVILLIHPQMGENIGAAARAMLNFGVRELRLVKPRDAWPNEKAYHLASGAASVLDNAKIYATTKEAIHDLEYLYATTARPRDMVKEMVTPETAMIRAHAHMKNNSARVGVLFGAERTGLENEDIVLADAIISIPVNPEYSSLNLAQSVSIVCYEWMRCANNTPAAIEEWGNSKPATREELLGLFEHFEYELDRAHFFKVADKRPKMVQNMRNMLMRSRLTDQDIRTLRGAIRALVEPDGVSRK